MSRDWAEAPRLLKVSCLIYTHALWGLSSLRGEKTSFVCTLMKQPYTPELMLILTSLATAIWLSNRSLCHTLWRLKHLLFFSLLPCGSLEGGRRNPEEGGSRWCDAYVLNDEVLNPPHPPTRRKAAAGSSLFLIHTHGRLSMSLLPTSGCVVK